MTVQIITGDSTQVLRTLPAASVHCCVTSPPYYGLRDYGVSGQIGLEETPDAYVARLVEVFREVRRVLRDDGTLWLNLGDSYGRGARCTNVNDSKRGTGRHAAITLARAYGGGTRIAQAHKNLLGIPWRVAFALQADGWYLRQDIIWHKPNPMPESVRDRCTRAHEYIFMLTKSARYHFDATAITEPSVRAGSIPGGSIKSSLPGIVPGACKQNLDRAAKKPVADKRNKRDVWTVSTRPYKGAHFATFPPRLIEPCVLAGCPAGGTVLDPFGGAGTTALVAAQHGRNALLIELSAQYVELATQRLATAGVNSSCAA